jgi:hypothetical protein
VTVDSVTVWTVTVIVIVCSAVDGVTVWTVTTVVMRMLCGCEECECTYGVNGYYTPCGEQTVKV